MKTLYFFITLAAIYLAFIYGGNTAGVVVSVLIVTLYIYVKLPYFYMLASSFKYQKNNEKAFKLMEKAYKTGRLKPDYKIYYGYLCLREGKTERAERIFNTILAKDKSDVVKNKTKVNLALLKLKEGNPNEAKTIIEELYPDYKTGHLYAAYGHILLDLGENKKAQEISLEGYEYDPSNEAVADNLGYSYYLNNENEKSREIYEELIAKKPKFPSPYYHFAKVLHAMGESEKAADLLRNALGFRFTYLSSVKESEAINLLDVIEKSIS